MAPETGTYVDEESIWDIPDGNTPISSVQKDMVISKLEESRLYAFALNRESLSGVSDTILDQIERIMNIKDSHFPGSIRLERDLYLKTMEADIVSICDFFSNPDNLQNFQENESNLFIHLIEHFYLLFKSWRIQEQVLWGFIKQIHESEILLGVVIDYVKWFWDSMLNNIYDDIFAKISFILMLLWIHKYNIVDDFDKNFHDIISRLWDKLTQSDISEDLVLTIFDIAISKFMLIRSVLRRDRADTTERYKIVLDLFQRLIIPNINEKTMQAMDMEWKLMANLWYAYVIDGGTPEEILKQTDEKINFQIQWYISKMQHFIGVPTPNENDQEYINKSKLYLFSNILNAKIEGWAAMSNIRDLSEDEINNNADMVRVLNFVSKASSNWFFNYSFIEFSVEWLSSQDLLKKVNDTFEEILESPYYWEELWIKDNIQSDTDVEIIANKDVSLSTIFIQIVKDILPRKGGENVKINNDEIRLLTQIVMGAIPYVDKFREDEKPNHELLYPLLELLEFLIHPSWSEMKNPIFERYRIHLSEYILEFLLKNYPTKLYVKWLRKIERISYGYSSLKVNFDSSRIYYLMALCFSKTAHYTNADAAKRCYLRFYNVTRKDYADQYQEYHKQMLKDIWWGSQPTGAHSLNEAIQQNDQSKENIFLKSLQSVQDHIVKWEIESVEELAIGLASLIKNSLFHDLFDVEIIRKDEQWDEILDFLTWVKEIDLPNIKYKLVFRYNWWRRDLFHNFIEKYETVVTDVVVNSISSLIGALQNRRRGEIDELTSFWGLKKLKSDMRAIEEWKTPSLKAVWWIEHEVRLVIDEEKDEPLESQNSLTSWEWTKEWLSTLISLKVRDLSVINELSWQEIADALLLKLSIILRRIRFKKSVDMVFYRWSWSEFYILVKNFQWDLNILFSLIYEELTPEIISIEEELINIRSKKYYTWDQQVKLHNVKIDMWTAVNQKDDVLFRADRARNYSTEHEVQWCTVYSKDLETESRSERLMREAHLTSTAIAEENLIPVFQPIVFRPRLLKRLSYIIANDWVKWLIDTVNILDAFSKSDGYNAKDMKNYISFIVDALSVSHVNFSPFSLLKSSTETDAVKEELSFKLIKFWEKLFVDDIWKRIKALKWILPLLEANISTKDSGFSSIQKLVTNIFQQANHQFNSVSWRLEEKPIADKYETLVRIYVDEKTVLTPYHFMDGAREYDMTQEIFHIMVKKSFLYITQRFRHQTPPHISFNLELTDLVEDNVKFMIEMCEKFKYPTNFVTLELLESIKSWDLMKKEPIVKQFFNAWFEMAIDDWWTEESNIWRLIDLKDARPKFIKLDRKIIDWIDQWPYQFLVARNEVKALHEIWAKVWAEWVERMTQIWLWLMIWIDFFQWFHPALWKPKMEMF